MPQSIHSGAAAAQTRRHPLPPTKPQTITSDAHALEVARALARDFEREAALRDRERRLPWDEIERYTASGLGTLLVPKAYGGPGVSLETMAEVFVILNAVDASLGQIPQNHFALLRTLADTGTEEQKHRWFADVLNGHRIGNAGPERKGRTPAMNFPTAQVSRTPEGLEVSGTRFYSTGALFAHWIPFVALDENGERAFVWVRHDAPGVEVVDDWSSFGQRTTASGTVTLSRVKIEARDIVRIGHLNTTPLINAPVSQLIQASIDAGIAIGALRDAIAYVRERARPWIDSGVERASDDPHLIGDIGRVQIDVNAAHEVLLQAARTLDEIDREPVTDASSARASAVVAEAKILTTEAALKASEKLLEAAGSSATRAAHNLDRHWRNARVHTLHDPVRWKYHLLGNYLLNGAYPRRHQWN
jgi:SfnB family sulfur acquisition oxidoreductase